MSEKKAEVKTFEQALSRLESIVKSLEGGTAELNESLGLFEEGVALIKTCNSLLDKAEQKIVMLTRGGENSEQPELQNAE